MLVNAYLLQLAMSAQLHCHNIYPPCSIRTCMEIKIVGSYLYQFSLFTGGYCFFWTAKCSTPARLYLYEDQFMPVFGYQIDFAITTTKVPFQNTVSLASQSCCRQALARPAQPLACGCYLLV